MHRVIIFAYLPLSWVRVECTLYTPFFFRSVPVVSRLYDDHVLCTLLDPSVHVNTRPNPLVNNEAYHRRTHDVNLGGRSASPITTNIE